MRGLKYATSDAWEIALLSHPSRMRGSKHGARKTILYTLKKRKEEKKWMELLSERQYYIY